MRWMQFGKIVSEACGELGISRKYPAPEIKEAGKTISTWDLNNRQIRTLSTAFSIAVLIAAPANSIRAAEIKVISADVFTGVIDEIAEEFTGISGHKIRIDYHTAYQVNTRIQSGEFADVIILNRPQLEDLVRRKKVAAESIVAFARSGVGMAVRAGVPKPDISTVEAFKRALLAAKSIGYPDPARGGLSGTHLMRVFDRL